VGAKPQHVVCFSCHVGQEKPTRNTFLGFPSFVCEACGAKSELPLSTSYFTTYVVSLLIACVALTAGRIAGCFMVLGVAAVPALYFHFRARNALAHAIANEKRLGERIAATFR